MSPLYVHWLLIALSADKLLYLLQFTHHPAPLFALNVAILSARENFDKRQAVRDSWLRHAALANRLWSNFGQPFTVNVHFVLGNQPCLVHPLNREELFNCEPKSVLEGDAVSGNRFNKLFELKPNKPTSLNVRNQWCSGFSFKTYHSIVVTQIGALSTLIDREGPLSVVILNAFTKKSVFSIAVSSENGSSSDSFYYSSDIHLELEAGSTFVILIEQQINFYDTDSVRLNLGPWSSVLRILRSYNGLTDFESTPFKPGDLLAVNFNFEINEDLSYARHSRSYTQSWLSKQQVISEKLMNESKTFQDIVFVNLVDVYRNLPQKLLLYFDQALNSNVPFTHLLKTDDDCYVNILLVIELLLHRYLEKFTWFGNFRKRWTVNYYGKWADESYTSPVYPHFACGSGYILTRDLVEWLNSNEHHLHRYQGEDVSMGIWMAAVMPRMVQVGGMPC